MNKLKLLIGLSTVRVISYSIMLIWTIIFLNTTYQTDSLTNDDAIKLLTYVAFLIMLTMINISSWLATIYWAVQINKEEEFPKLVLFTVISFFGIGTLIIIFKNKKGTR